MPITVNPVNDAPILDASKSPTFGTLNEDAGPPSGAVGVLLSDLIGLNPPAGGASTTADPDAISIGVAITGIDTAHGTLWYSADNGVNWVTYSSVPPASDSNAILIPANSRLYFQPAADFNGTLNDAITIRAWDQTNGAAGSTFNITATGGATAFSIATDTVAIAVNTQ